MITGDKLCLERYESQKACYAYFSRIFNEIRYDFKKYKEDKDGFKSEIDKFGDPVLRHIALYLIENYYEAQEYFSINGKWQNNYACESLNKWLDNKKRYFTHELHCNGNVHLWNKTIEPIWNELVKKSKENSGSPKKWCERYNFFREHLELPTELYPPICYKHVPQGYKYALAFPPNMCNLANTCKNINSYYKKCKEKMNGKDVTDFTSMFAQAIANGNSLFKGIDDVTISRQVQNLSCPSLNYATPISVYLSFFGTLFILFLLKKFTPLGSKLSYRVINNKRLRDNFNEQLENEEYVRSMNKNTHRGRRRNNVYYNSVEK